MRRFVLLSWLLTGACAGDQIRVDHREGTEGNYTLLPLTTAPGSVLTFDAQGIPIIGPMETGVTPGGADGAIQFNNAGALGGFGAWADGGLEIPGYVYATDGIYTTDAAFEGKVDILPTPGPSSLRIRGTIYTGVGAAPHVNIQTDFEPTPSWSTAGTALGINVPAGFAGNLIDAQVEGVSKFKMTSTGDLAAATSTAGHLGAGVNLKGGTATFGGEAQLKGGNAAGANFSGAYVFCYGGTSAGTGGTLEMGSGNGKLGGSGATSYGAFMSLIGANSNGTGGTFEMYGGGAAAGSNKQGGDIFLIPGMGNGTGRKGQLFPDLPTTDPAVAGALWNSSGMVVMSGTTAANLVTQAGNNAFTGANTFSNAAGVAITVPTGSGVPLTLTRTDGTLAYTNMLKVTRGSTSMLTLRDDGMMDVANAGLFTSGYVAIGYGNNSGNNGVGLEATRGIGWVAQTGQNAPIAYPPDVSLTRLGSANLRLGNIPSATPIAQTFTIGEASRPGTDTNVAGANGTIQSGLGTGTGAASQLIFQTPTAVGAGSGVQTYGTRLILNVAGLTTDQSVQANGNIVGNSVISTGGFFIASGLSILSSPVDGIWKMTNGALTDFSRLQLGGTTAAFPAIRRDGATISVVTADNSAFAGLRASTVTADSGITVGSGTSIAKVLSASASVNFASMATLTENTQTLTVTGAAAANTPSVQLGWAASLEAGIVVMQAWVSGANTVSIRVRNVTTGTIDPAAVTTRATVTSF